MRIEIKLAIASLALGFAIRFLGQYALGIQFEFTPFYSTSRHLLEWRVVSVAAFLVLYPVTLLVFYALGRTKVQKFRTWLSVLVTYGAGFAGETAGQTALRFVPGANAGFLFPFIYYADLLSSFTFLFIALSGYAFARLRSSESPPSKTSRGIYAVISLMVFFFFFAPSFWVGFLEFRFYIQATVSSFEVLDLTLLVLPVLQFLIFYYVGRKISIVGKPFRYFGLLFLGAYTGTVLGTTISVALFGQSYWSLPTGGGGGSFEYGIILSNLPQSPLLILESLIPVQSLPFIAFFAMSVSRLGRSNSSQSPLRQPPADEDEQTQHDNLVGAAVTEHGG